MTNGLQTSKAFDKKEEDDLFGFKQTESINHLKREGSKQKKIIQVA